MWLVSVVSAEVQMSCRGELLLRLHNELARQKQRAMVMAYRLLVDGEASPIFALQEGRPQDRDASA